MSSRKQKIDLGGEGVEKTKKSRWVRVEKMSNKAATQLDLYWSRFDTGGSEDGQKKSTLPPEILAKLPKQQSAQINPLNGQAYSVKYYDILKKRLTLPVWEYKDSFMATLDKHQTTVLVGKISQGGVKFLEKNYK